MGTNTMLAANGPLYKNVQGLDFRVLMYLAHKTFDNDRDGMPARTWLGGIAPIVEFLYDLTPEAPGYRAKYSAVQRSMRNLVDLGAIKRTSRGVGGTKSVYEICPLQGCL